MYRLNFKTLRFSSKKQILHNFAIIQSRKKIQKKKNSKKKTQILRLSTVYGNQKLCL